MLEYNITASVNRCSFSKKSFARKCIYIDLCSVSCLGESCTDVDDCKGTAPSVNCIGGTCKCAVGYSATNEGVCLQGED